MTSSQKQEKTIGASRRDFLRTSAAVGSAAILGGLSIGRSAHAAGSDTLKVGLVGCGSPRRRCGGQRDPRDKGVKLVALADTSPIGCSLRDKFSKKACPDQVDVDDSPLLCRVRRLQGSYCLRRRCVLLATPPHFRPMHLKACVDAGKHIFVEKPVGVDATGIRSVAATCEEAKKKSLSVAQDFAGVTIHAPKSPSNAFMTVRLGRSLPFMQPTFSASSGSVLGSLTGLR